MNDTVNMSKELVTEIPALGQYAGQQKICEDCGRVWIVECNNEDINLCLDMDQTENLKEIKKPTFLLTVLREETDPLAKVSSSNSPAQLTCVVICPKDKYVYQWKVNHEGKGFSAYSGCKLDPALHRSDLKRKDSQTSGYSDESITTSKPLNRKRRKIYIDNSDISGDMRTEKSDINIDVTKENSGINVDVRTDDALKAQKTMYSENNCETININIDKSRNIDCAVNNEIEMVVIKEESLKEETQDLFEATDQCTDPLDASTSLPEPNIKGAKYLESQKGKLQNTNMGGTLIVPLLTNMGGTLIVPLPNCLDMMVQAQTGQEMQAAGQNSQKTQAQTGQKLQGTGQNSQMVQPQSGQELQATEQNAQMVQTQSSQELQATGQNAQMVQTQSGQELQATGQNAQMVQTQSGQENQAAGQNSRKAQAQTGQEMQAAGQNSQMVQTQSGQELQATGQKAQMVQAQAGQEMQAAGQYSQKAQAQAGQEMQAAGQNARMVQPQSGQKIQDAGITYKCKICKIVYNNAYLFVKHIKEQNYSTCTICFKYYKTDRLLTKHVRSGHYNNMSGDIKAEAIEKTGVPEFEEKIGSIMCLNNSCMINGKYFPTLIKLREHMQHIHNEDQPKITHTFDTFEDFKSWKDEEEGRIGANYHKRRGFVNMKKTNTMKQLYHCKRTGTYTAKGQGKRILKSKGSSKIGAFCTSTMEVEECNKTKSISLTYYSKHSGHEMDIENLMHSKLCQIDKEKIAAKLKEGVPNCQILEEVRDTANNDRGKYLERRDIINVAMEFGLKK